MVPPLTVPGEFLGSPELPPSTFLRKINEAVTRFAVPPPHHVQVSLPCPLPPTLLTCKYVFVREDMATPSLAPLYRGPYLVLEQWSKFFRLQIRSKVDAVTVDRMKPSYSEDHIQPALPPVRGRPPLCPQTPGSTFPPPAPPPVPQKKRVTFDLSPAAPGRRNPPRAVKRRICSTFPPPFLLGGVLWRT